MILFLLLVLAAVALGITGALVEGLGYLLIVGIAVLVAALVFIAVHLSRRSGKHPIR